MLLSYARDCMIFGDLGVFKLENIYLWYFLELIFFFQNDLILQMTKEDKLFAGTNFFAISIPSVKF